ncbi:hypothetical protein [Knoellia sp. LjRoot47]|uniref:hypothetical protein n=1 Tax=Knoellia sp. LjRoot47 TaxID=3342330 RepID=UPI003ED02ED2
MRGANAIGLGLAGILAVVTLAGCQTEKDGRTFPDATDLTRAQAAWSDPWIAAAKATTVGPNGPAPAVSRSVAGRAYVTTSAPRAAVATEVRAATGAGWNLVQAECAPDEQGFPGAASAQLVRGTGDDAITALLRASTALPDTTPSASGSPVPGASDRTQVGLEAVVPHHLERAPAPSPSLDPATTCLFTGAAPTASPTDTAAPPVVSSPAALTGERVKPPVWPDEDTSDMAADVKVIEGDPGLASLGLKVGTPGSRGESEARDAAGGSVSGVAAPGGLPALVDSLTSSGWVLTYAACIGPGAPNVAELTRPAGTRSAVLRLSQVAAPPASSGPSTPASVDATVVLSTPGYSLAVPATVDDPCFSASPSPTSFSHSGTPHLGPTRMFPLIR